MVRRPMRSATHWPAEDFERAADLVELAIARQCAGIDRKPRLLGWLQALPEELLRCQARAQR